MFGHFKARRAMKQARRQYELAQLESLIAANKARLDEIERRKSEPCRACVDLGLIDLDNEAVAR